MSSFCISIATIRRRRSACFLLVACCYQEDADLVATLWIELLRMVDEPNEHLLGDLFRLVRIADHAQQKPKMAG